MRTTAVTPETGGIEGQVGRGRMRHAAPAQRLQAYWPSVRPERRPDPRHFGRVRRSRSILNTEITVDRLLMARVLPIINENDTLTIEDIRVGDNVRSHGSRNSPEPACCGGAG